MTASHNFVALAGLWMAATHMIFIRTLDTSMIHAAVLEYKWNLTDVVERHAGRVRGCRQA